MDKVQAEGCSLDQQRHAHCCCTNSREQVSYGRQNARSASGDVSMPISTIVKRNLADTGTLRVLTLNIYGQSAHWAARRQVLVDGIRQLAPDLIALQETIRTDDYDQVVELLGAEFHIVHSRERES